MAKRDSIPDWLLERYAVGELPAHRRDELTRALADDPGGAERLAALEQSNADMLDALPADEVAREVQRRLHVVEVAQRARRQQRRGRWLAAGAAMTAAAAVVSFVIVRGGNPERPHGGAIDDGARTAARTAPRRIDDGVRLKGDPQLLVHRKVDGGVEKLRSGDVARAGDRLQLSYVAAGHAHGVVLSIDGAGAVTLHYPQTPDGSTRLRAGGAVRLPLSYELDAAPAFERFVLLTSSAPIDVAGAVDSARAVARAQPRARAHDGDDARTRALELPPTVEQRSFIVRKESSP